MKSFHIDRNMKDKVKIRLAIEKVCKSKKKRNGRPTKKYRQAQKILANIDRYTDLIHTIVCETEEKEQAIKSGTYRDGDFPNALLHTFPVHLPASAKTGRFASLQAFRSFRIRSFTSWSSSLRKAFLCAGCTAFPAGQFRNEGFTRGSNTWNAISAETGAAVQSNMRRS